MGRPTKEDALIKQLSTPKREPVDENSNLQRQAPIAEDMFLPNHSGDHRNIQAKAVHIVSDVASDGPQYLAENTRTASAKVRFGIGELAPLTGAVTTQEAVFSANINKTSSVVNLDDTSAYGIYFYMLPKWAAGNEYLGFSYAEPQANPVTTFYYPIICDMVKKGAIFLGARTDGFSSAVEGQTVTIIPRENDDKLLALKKAAGTQSANMLEVQDENAGAMFSITPEGFPETTGQKRVSTQFDKTNDATLATITGLQVTQLVAAKSYYFRAVLFVNPDAVGGHKYAVSGTATFTDIKYQINSIDNATKAYVITSRQIAKDGAAGEASATGAYTEITGFFTVNTAGTVTIQFAQNAATPATTSSVMTGSHFIVEEIA